jgi:hypothetical protein
MGKRVYYSEDPQELYDGEVVVDQITLTIDDKSAWNLVGQLLKHLRTGDPDVCQVNLTGRGSVKVVDEGEEWP